MADFGSSITAFFGGDTSGLEKAVASAQTTVGAFQSALGKIGLTIGAGAVVGFFNSVIEKTSAINDMSDALGVSTDALQSLGYAVKLSGGEVKDTRLLWQTARKAIDELAAGTDEAKEKFKALGISQQDLIGIPLEQQLEKIAAGFVKNKGEAGAYGAITEIVGSRSAKLLGVLEDLGTNGFGSLESRARSAGQLIDNETVKSIDDLGDRLTTLKGRLTTAGAYFLDFVMKGAQGLGELAALSVNSWQGIETVVGGSAKQAEAAVVSIGAATEKLKSHIATTKDFIAYNEAEAKRDIERLDMKGDRQGKLNAMLTQARDYIAQAGRYTENSKEQLDLVGKANAVILEYDKEIVKARKEVSLSYTEQVELARLQLKGIWNLNESERLRYDILVLQTKQMGIQAEVKELIAKKESDGLTPAEKKRLSVLLGQSDAITSQIGAKQALIGVTNQQAAAETKVTEELARQSDLIKIMAGISTSKNFGDDETSVIEERKRRNEQKIQEINRGITTGPLSRGANLVDRTEVGRLTIENQNLQRELDLRRNITSILNTRGEAAALQAFPGDPRAFDRFITLAEGQDATTKLVQKDIGEIKNLLGIFRR